MKSLAVDLSPAYVKPRRSKQNTSYQGVTLRQRNDPYYFLFAISIGMLVYFIFYNFSDTSSLVPDAHTETELTTQQKTRDSIRKIGDIVIVSDKSVTPLKTMQRFPANASAEPENN